MKTLKGKDATAYARALDDEQKIHLLYEYVKLMRDNIVEGEPFILIDDDGNAEITAATIWPGNESANPYCGINEAISLVYGTTDPAALPFIARELLALERYTINWQAPGDPTQNNWPQFSALIYRIDHNQCSEWQYMYNYKAMQK